MEIGFFVTCFPLNYFFFWYLTAYQQCLENDLTNALKNKFMAQYLHYLQRGINNGCPAEKEKCLVSTRMIS
jgi:hypothetical protein